MKEARTIQSDSPVDCRALPAGRQCNHTSARGTRRRSLVTRSKQKSPAKRLGFFAAGEKRGSNDSIQQSGGRSGIAGWMAMGRRECPFVQTAPPQSRLINAVPALPRGEPSPSGKNVGDGLPESRWYAAIPAGWWNTGKRGVGDAAPYKLLYRVTLCVTAFLFQNLCKSLLTFPRNLI